ncbi:MAG: membrane dipeptidase [Candidatus Bathyarchaeia archaeon]
MVHHIDHVVNLVGVDHDDLGSDFDGKRCTEGIRRCDSDIQHYENTR